jgi:hypothetical protein
VLKPHSLILNRLDDCYFGFQGGGVVELFCSMAPLMNATPTSHYIFTEPVLESTFQTPKCYDLAHLDIANLAPEGQFYLKLGIRFKSEFFHEIEGIVSVENLYTMSAFDYQKWEISDSQISATIIFKRELPSLGN